MSYVDPERFKRFEQFLARYLVHFVDFSVRAFEAKGPGAVVYRPPDDRFGPIAEMKLEYKTRADIEAAQAGQRDELIQGILERYRPPEEAVFVAIYPDRSYDVTRLVIRRKENPSKSQPN
jgi:hypothetical protein